MINKGIPKYKWFQVISMLGMCFTLYAQEHYKLHQYTTKDGLSSDLCRRIHIDKLGFVWISSNNGLNRYDGNSIYAFKHDHLDPNSIASNRCNNFFEDSKGQLWISTSIGLSQFHHDKQNFTNYTPSIEGKVSNIGYTEMAEDHAGRIWLGGQYDVLIFDPVSNQFHNSGWYDFASKNGIIKDVLRNSIAQSVVKKSDEELWIMTVYGLFSVHTPTKQYQYHPHPKITDFFAFEISYIDESGTLWITTYNQCFFSYRPDTHDWQQHACPSGSSSITNIIGYDSEKLLVGMADGIKIYDKRAKTFATLDPYPINGKEKTTLSYFKKSADNLYLTSLGNFPFVHALKQDNIVQSHKLRLPPNFQNHQGFISASGKYLIGDWNKNEVKYCCGSDCHTLFDPFKGKQLGPLQMYFAAKDGRQFFSTSNGCYSLDENADQVINIIDQNTIGNVEHEFRNFVEDNVGNIYIRDRKTGIYLLPKGSQIASKLHLDIPMVEFGAMHYDQATSSLWLCDDKLGLFTVDLITKKIKNYPLSVFGCAKTGYINDIKGDENGNVYLLINGCGLVHLKSQIMKPTLYTNTEGLLTDGVSFGILDDHDLLWFSSESGLMAFDHKSARIFTFDVPEAKRFYNRLFLDDKRNIGQNADKEIIVFDRSATHQGLSDLKLYFKEILLLGKKIELDSLIYLNYQQNNISLSFGYHGAIKLPDRDFEYQINHGQWQRCQNMNLHLYNLNPGRYYVAIKYKYFQQSVLNTTFVIYPPWWQTWWFYFLILSLTIIALTWIYRWHIHNVRAEEAEKKQLNQRIAEIEMTALRSQMNPHFIFNCLNSINRFILTNDTDAASEYLTKFSRLIRLILDGSRSDFVALSVEMEALRLYIEMEAMRFQSSFEWEIDVDQSVNTNDILLPALLLQPFVENAIWHGLIQSPSEKVKKLQITVEQINNKCIIIIQDNGIGRQRAMMIKSKSGDQHKSHGISLSNERLQLMDKIHGTQSSIKIEDIFTTDELQCLGTKVTIILKNISYDSSDHR